MPLFVRSYGVFSYLTTLWTADIAILNVLLRMTDLEGLDIERTVLET